MKKYSKILGLAVLGSALVSTSHAADYASVTAAIADVSTQLTAAQVVFLSAATIAVGVFAIRTTVRLVKKALGIA